MVSRKFFLVAVVAAGLGLLAFNLIRRDDLRTLPVGLPAANLEVRDESSPVKASGPVSLETQPSRAEAVAANATAASSESTGTELAGTELTNTEPVDVEPAVPSSGAASIIGSVAAPGPLRDVELILVGAGRSESHIVPLDSDQAFRCDTTLVGKVEFRLRAHGLGEADVISIELAPGQTTDVGCLALHFGEALHGRLVFEGGEAFGDQQVTALPTKADSSGVRMGVGQARTGSDGTFLMEGLSEQVQLTLMHRRFEVIEGEFAFPGPDLHVVTVRGIRVNVRCVMVDPSGDEQPVPFTRLAATCTSGCSFAPGERATTFGSTSKRRPLDASFDAEVGGVYTVAAVDDEGHVYGGTFGPETKSGFAQLDLRRDRVVTGDVVLRVKRAGLPPTARLVVLDFLRNGDQVVYLTKEREGTSDGCSLRLGGAPMGAAAVAVVFVDAGAWAVEPAFRSIEISPGKTTEIEVEAVMGGWIELHVPDGLPAGHEGKQLWIRPVDPGAAWSPLTIMAPPTGMHRRASLRRTSRLSPGETMTSTTMPPGRYQISAGDQAGLGPMQFVEVAAGGPTCCEYPPDRAN